MGEISVKRLKLELSTARIEALTDGVFAIAMTLLVLNLGISTPQGGMSHEELQSTLGGLWPNFLHYVESFLILAIFWIKNHQQFHFIRRSDQKLLWLNLASLLFVCMLPFTTSLLSDYGDLSIAALIFEANLFAAGLIYYFQWSYATGDKRLVDSNLDGRIITAYKRSALVTPVVSVAAMVVSIFHPRWGTGLYFLIPFILIYIKRGMTSGNSE